MKPNPKRPWYRSSIAQCAFIAAVIFNVSFAPRYAFSVNLTNDEGCYISTLYKLMLQSSEGYCVGRLNYFAPGAPFLWLPAGWLALALSSFSQLWLFHWIQPLVSLYSFLLFAFATYFCFLSVRIFLDESSPRLRLGPWALTLAVLLNSPILYYSGKWTVMPHTAQVFAAFLTVYFLQKRRFFIASLCGLLLSFTRFNDVPVLVMILGKAWDERTAWSPGAKRFFHRKAAVAGVAVVFLAAGAFIGWKAFIQGYGTTTLSNIFLTVSLAKLNFFLFHDRWGVFWMTPWWTISIAFGLVSFHRLSNYARGALVWLLIEAYVATAWAGNGGDFGYRYLLGSFAAAWVVWKDLVAIYGPKFRSFFVGLTLVGAFWMTYLYVAYRSVSELAPNLIPIDLEHPNALVFGGIQHFQLAALKRFFDPAIYKGWFNQDIPLVELWKVWFVAPEEERLRGTDQLALAVATLGSLFYIAVFARRNLSHFLACRKASRKAETETPSAATTPPESPSVP